jgi:hypothetical protein
VLEQQANLYLHGPEAE